MTYLLNTLDIIIMHRDKDGKSDFIYPYNGDTATHVTGCANLARSILATERGERSFIKLGDKFESGTDLERWYKPIEMEVVAKRFLNIVKTKWPPTFLEESMENPDESGATFRTWWDLNFDTREHPISLNAARIRDLCTAGRMAKANPNKNSKDHQRYRRFVYNTATTMVHEFAHMFITFLAQGRSNTPPGMQGDRAAAPKGEAGDELEQLLFGGIHVVIRNTDEDEAQSGDPHLLDKAQGLRTITQATVDKTVKYEFNFPLPTVPTVDARKKQTMGQLLPLPGNNLSNPVSWPETMKLFAVRDHFGATTNPFNLEHFEKLAELLAKNANPRNLQSGPSSAIYRLPFNPGLKPEPVKPQ